MYKRGRNSWRFHVYDPRTKRRVHRTFRGTKNGGGPHEVPRAPPPPTSDQSKAATPGEVAAFLEAARAQGQDDFEHAAFVAITGMRRGEVVGLQFEDVDLAAGWAEISRVAVYESPCEEVQPDGTAEITGDGKALRPWGKTPGATRKVRLDAASVAIVAARRERREKALVDTGHDPARDGLGFVFSPDPLGADF